VGLVGANHFGSERKRRRSLKRNKEMEEINRCGLVTLKRRAIP
jgi:hypothetical protein